jgi:anaerobic magnesium-protoporphyrin IX monomethyl ester cyclase
MFGKKLRSRTPQQVADEMQQIHDTYGISGFMWHDDNLTANRKWLYEFFRCMTKLTFFPLWCANSRIDTVDDELLHDMAIYGCRGLHYGLESGSQRILDSIYEKRIRLEQVREVVETTRKYRIAVGAFLMLNAPTETEQELQQTVDLALSLPLDEVSMSICVPLPGTYLYDRMRAEGQHLSTRAEDYDYYSAQPMQTIIPLGRVKQMRRDALLRFYWQRKGYILSHLTSVDGVRHLAQKVSRSW